MFYEILIIFLEGILKKIHLLSLHRLMQNLDMSMILIETD